MVLGIKSDAREAKVSQDRVRSEAASAAKGGKQTRYREV
jgi:hypothetical protein